MAASEQTSPARLLTWRVTGFWMVAVAIGLALLGIFLAIKQGNSLTALLTIQARNRAVDIAREAREKFYHMLDDAMDALDAQAISARSDGWRPAPDWPDWLTGVFTWNGRTLHALRRPSPFSPGQNQWIIARLAAVESLETAESTPRNTRIIYGQGEKQMRAFACRPLVEGLPGSFTTVAWIDTDRLRSTFLEPLLFPSDGLEVVTGGAADDGRWTQRLYSAMRLWELRPTRAYIRGQTTAILWQTRFHLALTVLALATLLAAMWFLVRLTRREVALAEMKSNFVADVSHELKTPLAVIQLYSDTLQSGRIQSEQKRQQYYAIITREITRLGKMIHNILDFARIESGRTEFAMKPTDVAAVVRETYEAYRAELDRSGFEHHLTIEESLPFVDADRDAITQIVFNLLSNAAKYSGEDRYLAVELTHDTRRDRRGVLISVHDHGFGISPEDRAHLFEGFYRAADSRVREKGGAGLGLALVKHIVDAHRGTIDVESRLVKGTTFRIFLPVAEADAPTKTGGPSSQMQPDEDGEPHSAAAPTTETS